MCATAVQKHIVGFAWLDSHQVAVQKPQAQLVYGAVRDGYEALFVALAVHTNKVLVEKQVAHLQRYQFAHTQAARKQHLDDGAVALSLVC